MIKSSYLVAFFGMGSALYGMDDGLRAEQEAHYEEIFWQFLDRLAIDEKIAESLWDFTRRSADLTDTSKPHRVIDQHVISESRPREWHPPVYHVPRLRVLQAVQRFPECSVFENHDFSRQELSIFTDLMTIRNMMVALINKTTLSCGRSTRKHERFSINDFDTYATPYFIKRGLRLRGFMQGEEPSIISPLGTLSLPMPFPISRTDWARGREKEDAQDVFNNLKKALGAEPVTTPFLGDEDLNDFEVTRIQGKKIPEVAFFSDEELIGKLRDQDKALERNKDLVNFYLQQGGIVDEVEDIEDRKARFDR